MKITKWRLATTSLLLGSLLSGVVSTSLVEVLAADTSQSSGESVMATKESAKAEERQTSAELDEADQTVETEETRETVASTETSETVASSEGVTAETLLSNVKPAAMRSAESGFVPATPEEIKAANDAANQKIGFDPEVKVESVKNWAEFRTAYQDASVTKIILLNDISNTANQTMSMRRTSIEVDGKGFKLHLNRQSMEINSPTDGIGFFHVHDVIAQQGLNNQLSGAGVYAFVNGTHFAANVEGWTFRTGNVTTEAINGNRVGRFIRAYQAEIQVYGKMQLITTEENFYAGSVIMEDKTEYYGEVTFANYSVIWYVEKSNRPKSTSKSEEFTVGKNCLVRMTQSQTNGTDYPAVFDQYQTLTIGENSVWNVSMPGNAVRLQHANAAATIKAGAVVNLTSTRPGLNVISFAQDNQRFKVEPTASLFVIGNSTQPLIDMGREGFTGVGRRNNLNGLFEVDSPKIYDFRNVNNSADSTVLKAANTNRADNNNFRIINSDVDIWQMGQPVLGPSTHTYTQVTNFNVLGNGRSEVVTSSNTELASTFQQSNYRRISGMNQTPTIEWTPVTDADFSYEMRVKIGETPDNQFGPNGEVVWVPVYASLNQAEVTVVDTFGESRKVKTNRDGYAKVTDTKFNQTGGELSADAARGPWESVEPAKTTVIDVTPPEPAKVDNEERVSPISKELSGTGEVNANVSFTLNNVAQTSWNTVVDNDGKWNITLPAGLLKQDDQIQIFLQDKAGKAAVANPPATNSDVGNINPAKELKYRDATFKAAKVVTVNGILMLTSAPKNISFGSVSVLDFEKQIGVDKGNIDMGLIVEDTRGARDKWDITAQVVEEMTNDGDQLVGAIKYYYNDELLTLKSSPQTIYTNPANDSRLTYNITDDWGKAVKQDGLKLQPKGDIVPKTTGSYTGTVKWTLRDTIE